MAHDGEGVGLGLSHAAADRKQHEQVRYLGHVVAGVVVVGVLVVVL
jgi:hypothetical protein